MTAVTFFTEHEEIVGFYIAGHSTNDDKDVEGKTVCAAVSSAAYMTVNTVTEIIGAEVEADVEDGEMKIRLLNKIGESQEILKGFQLHIKELAKQHKQRIKVISEV